MQWLKKVIDTIRNIGGSVLHIASCDGWCRNLQQAGYGASFVVYWSVVSMLVVTC